MRTSNEGHVPDLARKQEVLVAAGDEENFEFRAVVREGEHSAGERLLELQSFCIELQAIAEAHPLPLCLALQGHPTEVNEQAAARSQGRGLHGAAVSSAGF